MPHIVGATQHPHNDILTKSEVETLIADAQLYRVTSSAPLNFDFWDCIRRSAHDEEKDRPNRHYAEEYSPVGSLSDIVDFESSTYETLAVCEDIENEEEAFWTLTLRKLDDDLELDRDLILNEIITHSSFSGSVAVLVDNWDEVIDDQAEPEFSFRHLSQNESFQSEPDEVVLYVPLMRFCDFWDGTLHNAGENAETLLKDDPDTYPFLTVGDDVEISDHEGLFAYALANWDLDEWQYSCTEFLARKWATE